MCKERVVAYIRTVAPAQAQGRLRQLYDQAQRRAGYVAQVLRLMSVDPGVLEASVNLYLQLMHAPGPLSRAQRELIAVVVSRANNCYY